ncbi:MAG TPA: hypothetical protein VHZ03_18795, partial [Trebonia sp.]|nr:hypothetical protein [Trebonia sp.]
QQGARHLMDCEASQVQVLPSYGQQRVHGGRAEPALGMVVLGDHDPPANLRMSGGFEVASEGFVPSGAWCWATQPTSKPSSSAATNNSTALR